MAVLQTEKLTKEFPSGEGRLTVLHEIDLKVEPGESLAITGPSGSGKSTLLSLMAGLDRPTGGRVLLFGQDLNSLSEDELARLWGKRVGFIFQSYRLLPMLSAEENVRVPLELSGSAGAGEKARKWLKKVGLDERRRHLPAQLSGGEQQRVALARAMASEPDILFADEPTGNLDLHTGQEMSDLLFSLLKERGTTLVLITHERPLAERARRIIELEDGRVVKDERAKAARA